MTGAHRAGERAVVLVPGLWMSDMSLALLGLRLRTWGFIPYQFSYRSVARTVEENAALLGGFVASVPAREVHVVGHSLGGLIVLEMLAHHADPRPGRVVLMGTCVRGSHAARGLAQYPFGRLLLGKSRHALCGECAPLPRERELGVIAGSLSLGLGARLFPGPEGPDDGVVWVRETELAGSTDQVVLSVSHTGMLVSPCVARQVGRFLLEGRFDHIDT
jgi:pimeloyl-ACP methyl ester carboxylesterase